MLPAGNAALPMAVPTEQHDLPVEALDYPLPERLIATRPAEPRDAARLLVLRRGGGPLAHHHVRDLPAFLDPGDVLVFNNTAVAPARLVGRRVDTGGRVEGLFITERDDSMWEVLLKSNGRLRAGVKVGLVDAAEQATEFVLELVSRCGAGWVVRTEGGGRASDMLEFAGRTPLPPYILRARGAMHVDDALDRQWYQTVYADPDRRQSVAAPTAGLHFTPRLLAALDKRGVRRTHLTLHVGPGTFKPISAATIGQHPMHREHFEVSAEALATIRRARSDGAAAPGRVIAVGTTTVRTLESLPAPLPNPAAAPIRSETDLLIAPPYAFRHVDGLLTNFHLPRSTLLALVGAMVGLERLIEVYGEAVERGYRFYSYGDAMLILP